MQQCHRELGARGRWENHQQRSHYSRNLKRNIREPIYLMAAAKALGWILLFAL